MVEKESGCVMHENAFVNTSCLVSLAPETIGDPSAPEIRENRQDRCLCSVICVHTVRRSSDRACVTPEGLFTARCWGGKMMEANRN